MRKLLIIIALLFIWCVPMTCHAQVGNKFDLGDWASIQKYSSSLATAISTIGADHERLVINTTVTLGADANAPDNIAFEISENGLITLGNYNLYIHGDFRCEPGNRAFNVSGSGRVYFRGAIDRVYPGWFGALGDGVTDDTNALNYCFLSYNWIESPPELTYLITSSVQYRNRQSINFNKSTIKGNLTSDNLLEASAYDHSNVTIKNLIIDNTDPNNAGSIGLSSYGTQKSRFENLRIINVETGMKFYSSSYWNDIYSPNIEYTKIGMHFIDLPNECTVFGGNVDHCNIGCLIETTNYPATTLNHIKIYGTAFEDFTRGIKIIDSWWTYISSPRFDTAKGSSVGIFLQGDCKYTSIISSHFDGPTSYIDGNTQDLDGLVYLNGINNSNMGIRTVNPQYPVDWLAKDANAPFLRIRKPSATYPRAFIGIQNFGYVVWYMGIDNYDLYLGKSNEGQKLFTFTVDGKFGIGEITPGAELDVDGLTRIRVDSRSIVDNGTGSSPATLTLIPTSSYVTIICNDADGCNITMGETGMVEGIELKIVNVSTNACNFADSSGVSELSGAIALGQFDSLTLLYISDRWIQTSTSNN